MGIVLGGGRGMRADEGIACAWGGGLGCWVEGEGGISFEGEGIVGVEFAF